MSLPAAVCAPPADRAGEEALDAFAASPQYNRFLWRSLARLSPARGRVLEVGCGIGNLTRLVLEEKDVTQLHAIDPDPAYVARLTTAIADPRLSASAAPLASFCPPGHSEAADASFDRIVCSNVLEHIEDDLAALSAFRRLLRPGGDALLLVPAHRWLYCGLDRALSHHRRYAPEDLRGLASAAGLELAACRHFNPLAVAGWWLNGKVLRRSRLPVSQVRAYSRFAVPVSALLDRLNPLPLGISLLALLRKPAPIGK